MIYDKLNDRVHRHLSKKATFKSEKLPLKELQLYLKNKKLPN